MILEKTYNALFDLEGKYLAQNAEKGIDRVEFLDELFGHRNLDMVIAIIDQEIRAEGIVGQDSIDKYSYLTKLFRHLCHTGVEYLGTFEVPEYNDTGISMDQLLRLLSQPRSSMDFEEVRQVDLYKDEKSLHYLVGPDKAEFVPEGQCKLLKVTGTWATELFGLPGNTEFGDIFERKDDGFVKVSGRSVAGRLIRSDYFIPR